MALLFRSKAMWCFYRKLFVSNCQHPEKQVHVLFNINDLTPEMPVSLAKLLFIKFFASSCCQQN